MVIERKKENKLVQKSRVIMASLFVSSSMMCVNVCAKPSFNEGGFKSETKNWTEPIMNFLLWATIPVGGIICVLTGVYWLLHDEEYKEQHPLKRRLTPIVIGTIVLELIPTIFKLLNLTS